MLFRTTFVAMLLSMSSAFAADGAYQCSFKSECLETDACADTNFKMSVESVKHADTASADAKQITSRIVTDAETVDARKLHSEDKKITTVWASRKNGDFHSLTVAEDGTARYSVHMPTSELAIYYLGTCSVTP